MPENKNEIQVDATPFIKNKILLAIFFFFSLLNSIIASLVQRGAFADGVVALMAILNNLACGNSGYLFDLTHHPRLFITLINEFPVNFAYSVLGIVDKQLLTIIFSLPLFLFPLIGLVFNCFLSKRTKRFDIAILGLGLYFLTIAPSALYSIVELRLAVVFYIILLNYLVGKIDYTKSDVGIILFLVLMLFNSHELVLIIGVLFFLMSFYYGKKESNPFNKKVKYFIGYSSLIAALYMAYWFFTRPIIGEAVRYFGEAKDSLVVVTGSFGILTFISFFLILLCIFYKKYFSKPIVIGLACLSVAVFSWFYSNLDMYINFYFFSFRTWSCFVLPVAIVFVFIVDYFKLKVGKVFYSNVLTIICFTGILYTLWQLNHSYLFYRDYQYFKCRIDSISEKIVTPEEYTDIYSIPELRRYHTADTFTTESILFSDKRKINTIILPPASVNDPNYNFYIDDSGMLQLPYVKINIKNQFWDLTDVAKQLEGNKTKYEMRKNP